MTQTPSADRAWIASEFVKGIELEKVLAADANARAGSPPEPALGVVYHEIAAADERHATILDTIATRYGHTPSRSTGGGFGRAWSRLKDSVGEMGSDGLDHLSWDLAAKTQSAQWYAAWVDALQAIGDVESARELSAVLAEEEGHRNALQECYRRMIERRARGSDDLKT